MLPLVHTFQLNPERAYVGDTPFLLAKTTRRLQFKNLHVCVAVPQLGTATGQYPVLSKISGIERKHPTLLKTQPA